MKVLIDNGHGVDTKGKRSPDGRLLEYKWAREIAVRLEAALKAKGLDAERIVPEENDVQLKVRSSRVNAICKKHGSRNCVLVSIHINAAANKGWNTATGWSGWVAPNASSNSKRFAQILYDAAKARGLQGNRSVPKERYWVGNYAIVRDTNCPAVLTENLFQDNKDEVDYLLSEEGKQTIVDLHVEGILKYISEAQS
jgi:N-acetylmuramoyl-L-alanine amidase